MSETPRRSAPLFLLLTLALLVSLWWGTRGQEPSPETSEVGAPEEAGAAGREPPDDGEPRSRSARPARGPFAEDDGDARGRGDDDDSAEGEGEGRDPVDDPDGAFALYDANGGHGAAFEEVDRRLAECLRTWPASDPRLFHMRGYSLRFAVPPAGEDGLSPLTDVAFEVFVGAKETGLDNTFFSGCVTGSLEDLRVAGASGGKASFTVDGTTEFNVYQQLEVLRNNPELLASKGMTMKQLDALEQQIHDADPDY